jgi:WD40 repeat protein
VRRFTPVLFTPQVRSVLKFFARLLRPDPPPKTWSALPRKTQLLSVHLICELCLHRRNLRFTNDDQTTEWGVNGNLEAHDLISRATCYLRVCIAVAFAVAFSVVTVHRSLGEEQHAQLRVETGHTEPITNSAFSSDGSLLLTATGKAGDRFIGDRFVGDHFVGDRFAGDNFAVLWDATNGKELQQLIGHRGGVLCTAISPDDKRLLTVGIDTTARIWSATTGVEISQLNLKGVVPTGCAWSPKDDEIAIGTQNGAIRLYDATTKRLRREVIPGKGPVGDLAFSRDGANLAGVSSSKLLVWRLATSVVISLGEEVVSLTWLPEADAIVTACVEDTVRLWDIHTAKAEIVWQGRFGQSLKRAFFTPSRDKIVVVMDSLFYFNPRYALQSPEDIVFEKKHPGNTISSPNGEFIFTGDSLIESVSRRTIWRFNSAVSSTAVRVFGDGKSLMVGGALWSLTSGRVIREFKGGPPFYSVASDENSLCFANQPPSNAPYYDPTWQTIDPITGQTVASGSSGTCRPSTGKDEQLRREAVWEYTWLRTAADPWNQHRLMLPTDSNLNYVDRISQSRKTANDLLKKYHWWGFSGDISSNGRYVIVIEGDAEYIHDTANGKILYRFLDAKGGMFSPDGSLFIYHKNDIPHTFSLRDGKDKVWPTPPLEQFIVDIGTERALTFQNNKLEIWDLPEAKSLYHLNDVLGYFITPDLGHILLSKRDGSIELVTFAELRSQCTLKQVPPDMASPSNITRQDRLIAEVMPDGDHLVIGGVSGAYVFDTRTGAKEVGLFHFSDAFWAAADSAGHYDASNPDIAESVYWVTDSLRTLDLGQLKHEYYTPGLLARVISKARLRDVAGMDRVALPALISAPQYDPYTHLIHFSVTNDGGGVGSLVISVNGRRVKTLAHAASPAPGQSQQVAVDLSSAPWIAGANSVRLVIFDSADRIASNPVDMTYESTTSLDKASPLAAKPTVTTSIGRLYAILVGTSTFSGDPKTMNLLFPSRDAANLATALRLGGERLYGKDRISIQLLTSDATNSSKLPTKDNIHAAFDYVRSRARPEDTFIVYLSGHGAVGYPKGLNDEVYYYFTVDAASLDTGNDKLLLDRSTVSSNDLFEWLREPVNTMPLKQVVIIDTCAAGAAGHEMRRLAEPREISPDQLKAMQDLKDATGTFVLMGSAADKNSYEASRFGEGLVTYALLEGMRGDALKGSTLDVLSWFEYAAKKVPELARSVGGIQQPELVTPQSQPFPVAVLTADDRLRIPLALPKQEVLQPLCLNEDQSDPLHLTSLLAEQMRAVEYSFARGQEAPVVFLESTDEEFPGALMPRVLYRKSASVITARIRLYRNEEQVAEEISVIGSEASLGSLAAQLASKIVTLSQTVPLNAGSK